MKEFDIDGYLSAMTDSELVDAFKQAESDLAEAAAQKPNSDRHQECFAGLIVFCAELQKRGLTVHNPH